MAIHTVLMLQPLKLPNGNFALPDAYSIRENIFTKGYIPDNYITINKGDTVNVAGYYNVKFF